MTADRGIDRSRGVEQLIYFSMWLLVVMFPLISELLQAARGNVFSWKDVSWWWGGMLPYLVLFLIHNYVLIPSYLFDHKLKRYSFGVFLLIASFAVYEIFAFDDRRTVLNSPDAMEQVLRSPLEMPMPLLLNVLLAFLMLGFNLAIVLLFRNQREQEHRKILDNMRMQEELKYLKAQLNPHFFMNMLNNIHATVEVDQPKAQDMILELSKLMRYVLYDGENEMTTFAQEVRFISSYVALMRQRYPADKVSIELNVPEFPSDRVKLPPLLFIAFVENAFKHGISYRRKSVIKISMASSDGTIRFFCRNTKPEKSSDESTKGGVGLENVRRRLALLYGDDASLRIENGSDYFTVNLTIPCR